LRVQPTETQQDNSPKQRKRSVPLFGKEGLGEIFINCINPPPFFSKGGMLAEQRLFLDIALPRVRGLTLLRTNGILDDSSEFFIRAE